MLINLVRGRVLIILLLLIDQIDLLVWEFLFCNHLNSWIVQLLNPLLWLLSISNWLHVSIVRRNVSDLGLVLLLLLLIVRHSTFINEELRLKYLRRLHDLNLLNLILGLLLLLLQLLIFSLVVFESFD